MTLALTPAERAIVVDILDRLLPGASVSAFGSRAAGRPKRFSDLDLAVADASPLAVARLAALAEAFDDSDLPFKVDVVDLRAADPAFVARIAPTLVPLR